jgi:hypothetical protein
MSARKYTTLQLSLQDANKLCYRDVIRVERVEEYNPVYDNIPDHDTLVVLKNGKLLRVYSWKDKNYPHDLYDTIFEYLHKLVMDKESYFSVTLNQFCGDPNILHRTVQTLVSASSSIQPPWTCPNDDAVYPWEYHGRMYLRNYHNMVWKQDVDGSCGDWVGVYLELTHSINHYAEEPAEYRS